MNIKVTEYREKQRKSQKETCRKLREIVIYAFPDIEKIFNIILTIM